MPTPTPQRIVPRPLVKPQNLIKSPSVWDEVVPIGEDRDEGIKILIYGESGTGKTTCASTFPEPLLWVQCSGSKNPGELLSVDTPENAGRIKKFTPKKSSQVGEIIDGVVAKGFNTFVLDHLSGLEGMIFCEVTGIDEMPDRKTWGMCTWDQYGQIGAQEMVYVRKLLNLRGINVVVLAQERVFKPKDDNSATEVEEMTDASAPKTGPGVLPAVAKIILPAFSYYVQTYKAPRFKTETVGEGAAKIQIQKRLPGVEYRIRTEAHPTIMTKFRVPVSRSQKMPGHIVDPTYAKLVKLIRG